MKVRKPGFTIIELLFAVVVLGVMLSLVMTTIIGMLRFYTFANYIRENQQNGRNVLDTITREVRFGSLVLPSEAAPNSSILCVSDDRKKTLTRYERQGSTLVRTQFGYPNIELSQVINCDGSGGATVISPTKQVSGVKMTVTNFVVNRTAGAPGTATDKATAVRISFSYGTGSVNAVGGCDPGDIYCSVLSLTTAINIRGGGQ